MKEETQLWLKFGDLVARGLVANRATLYRWIDAGIFPGGTLIGPNTRAWRRDEIEAFEAARPKMIKPGRQRFSRAAAST